MVVVFPFFFTIYERFTLRRIVSGELLRGINGTAIGWGSVLPMQFWFFGTRLSYGSAKLVFDSGKLESVAKRLF